MRDIKLNPADDFSLSGDSTMCLDVPRRSHGNVTLVCDVLFPSTSGRQNRCVLHGHKELNHILFYKHKKVKEHNNVAQANDSKLAEKFSRPLAEW